MCVCVFGRSCWCLFLCRTVTWYGYRDAFLLSGGDPADFLLHVEPCQRIRFIWWADLRLYNAIRVHVCARLCVRSVPFGCVPFVCNAKADCGCSSRCTGVSLHPCTQVLRCEIRWWFVEGDNEQSAILTGWALSCQRQRCYPPSDFSQSMLLLFFFLIILKRKSLESLFSAEIWQQRFYECWSKIKQIQYLNKTMLLR